MTLIDELTRNCLGIRVTRRVNDNGIQPLTPHRYPRATQT